MASRSIFGFAIALFFTPFAFASLSQSLASGDYAQAFSDAVFEFQLMKIAAVLLGVVIIGLIALRVSALLNKPKVDLQAVAKEEERKDTERMLSEKDVI